MALQDREIRFINKRALKEFQSLPENIQERFALDLNAVKSGKEPFSMSISVENFPPVSVQKFPHGLVG